MVVEGSRCFVRSRNTSRKQRVFSHPRFEFWVLPPPVFHLHQKRNTVQAHRIPIKRVRYIYLLLHGFDSWNFVWDQLGPVNIPFQSPWILYGKEGFLQIPGSSKCVKFMPFHPKKPTKRQKFDISGGFFRIFSFFLTPPRDPTKTWRHFSPLATLR